MKRRRRDHTGQSDGAQKASKQLRLGEGLVVDYPAPTSANASAVMRGNRKRDTIPELAVRRALHARGRRYRVNALLRIGRVRVRPDLVFPRQRVAVFVDGCFWHGCADHGTNPRSNQAYWELKISRNKARDERNTSALTSAGWRVIRVWEHEEVMNVIARIERALHG